MLSISNINACVCSIHTEETEIEFFSFHEKCIKARRREILCGVEA